MANFGKAVRHALLAMAIGYVTAACTTQPGPQPASTPTDNPTSKSRAAAPDYSALWAQRVAELAAWEEWRVKGKVAYKMPEDAGSANLHWSQLGEASTLRLSGPLGAASTRVSNEGALLRVRRDGIERLYPADAAPWLPGNRLLPVPIDSIHHWLRGVPDPSLPLDHLERDQALAVAISQGDWNVRYLDYRDYQGISLPSRLKLTALESQLTLTVILRGWEISAPP